MRVWRLMNGMLPLLFSSTFDVEFGSKKISQTFRCSRFCCMRLGSAVSCNHLHHDHHRPVSSSRETENDAVCQRVRGELMATQQPVVRVALWLVSASPGYWAIAPVARCVTAVSVYVLLTPVAVCRAAGTLWVHVTCVGTRSESEVASNPSWKKNVFVLFTH